MGKSQRDKGARGEREVADLFEDQGLKARRGMRQSQDATGEPDVVVEPAPWLWVEVKRGKTTRPVAALKQAIKAAGANRVPIAVTRDDYDAPVVTLRFADFIGFIRDAYPAIFQQPSLPQIQEKLPANDASSFGQNRAPEK